MAASRAPAANSRGCMGLSKKEGHARGRLIRTSTSKDYALCAASVNIAARRGDCPVKFLMKPRGKLTGLDTDGCVLSYWIAGVYVSEFRRLEVLALRQSLSQG